MARKNVSLVVSGAGWIAHFTDRLVEGLRAQGISDEEIHALVTRKGELRMEKIVSAVAESIRTPAGMIVPPTPEMVVPDGGRIHRITVPVDESRAWNDAVRAAGPDTPEDWAVWQVGGLYPATVGAILAPQEIILANFGTKFVPSEEVLAWGRERKLCPASPRAVFAIGEHLPGLNRDLGLPIMGVVSLVPVTFKGERHVCAVWWSRARRDANLNRFGLGWDESDWFAFVREL
ncbi:MAG: hypothetical protein G01um101433_377 [Parcubacteria group bacterium Gr01-1014_33]|nr:MAG: hypothetical protein G01um101433_377 [Parcubacteria group bacterium Gr01-1014_33]